LPNDTAIRRCRILVLAVRSLWQYCFAPNAAGASTVNADEASAEWSVFLSSLPASEQVCRFAGRVALVSLGGFLLCAPFAQVKLPEV